MATAKDIQCFLKQQEEQGWKKMIRKKAKKDLKLSAANIARCMTSNQRKKLNF